MFPTSGWNSQDLATSLISVLRSSRYCHTAAVEASSILHSETGALAPLFRGNALAASILFLFPVFDDELQALVAVVFVDVQAVYGMDTFGQRFVVSKQDRVDGQAIFG